MSKVLKIAGGLLGKVAPSIATALGGPLGGVAVFILAKVLGIDDADESSILDYIERNQNPDLALKLKIAEQEFAVSLKELDIEMKELEFQADKLIVDDRISARDMAAQTKSKATAYLSAAVLLGFAFIIIALFVFEPPESARGVLFILLGSLATAVAQVMNFWFGSSNGSKVKEQQIGEFMNYAQSVRGQMALREADDAVGAAIMPVSVSALPPALPNPRNG